MTPEHGRGLQALRKLADDAIKRMPREDARSFIDSLQHEELADLMDAASAAGVATGTGGNLFYESAAARLRDIKPVDFPRPLSNAELVERQAPMMIYGSPPCRNFASKGESDRFLRVGVEASGDPSFTAKRKPTKRSRR